MAKEISIEEMMEAGMHFGHQTHRRNPKMDRYIFDSKSGVHIIDLTKTEALLKEALKFIGELAQGGSQIIFVGSKRQAGPIIQQGAESCNMPYVNERWLGGLLTNHETIKKRLKYLRELDEKFATDSFEGITKKEKVELDKVHKTLIHSLGGLRHLAGMPGAVFVADVVKDQIAVKEAKKMGIPVIAIVDTNVNPDPIDYPIPANDDAKKSIEYIVGKIAEACSAAGASKAKAEQETAAAKVEETETPAEVVAE